MNGGDAAGGGVRGWPLDRPGHISSFVIKIVGDCIVGASVEQA